MGGIADCGTLETGGLVLKRMPPFASPAAKCPQYSICADEKWSVVAIGLKGEVPQPVFRRRGSPLAPLPNGTGSITLPKRKNTNRRKRKAKKVRNLLSLRYRIDRTLTHRSLLQGHRLSSPPPDVMFTKPEVMYPKPADMYMKPPQQRHHLLHLSTPVLILLLILKSCKVKSEKETKRTRRIRRRRR